jgi:hypothetical protein
LGREDGAAPPVEDGVVEADDELEAVIGAPEDVYLEEQPPLPIEDMPLTSFSPF